MNAENKNLPVIFGCRFSLVLWRNRIGDKVTLAVAVVVDVEAAAAVVVVVELSASTTTTLSLLLLLHRCWIADFVTTAAIVSISTVLGMRFDRSARSSSRSLKLGAPAEAAAADEAAAAAAAAAAANNRTSRTWAARLSVYISGTAPLTACGGGGTRSHAYCLCSAIGAPAAKSKPHRSQAATWCFFNSFSTKLCGKKLYFVIFKLFKYYPLHSCCCCYCS